MFWQFDSTQGKALTAHAPLIWFIRMFVFVIGWAQSEGRRNPEMQHVAGEEKSQRCFMNWPENYPSPTASPLTWIKHQSWDSHSVTCACVSYWTQVREDKCSVRSCSEFVCMLSSLSLFRYTGCGDWTGLSVEQFISESSGWVSHGSFCWWWHRLPVRECQQVSRPTSGDFRGF